jgi:acyl dehydratase
MALNYHYIKNRPFEPVIHVYSARDTMLYAVGVGVAATVADTPEDMKFVYEPMLVALPTMAAVLAQPSSFWVAEPEAGIDWHYMLHTEQFLRIHKPLAPAATVVGQTRVIDIHDKGPEKGALLLIENELRDATTKELLATCGFSALLRKNGGFGGTAAGIPVQHPAPEGGPDFTLDLPTRPEQAFIYRLSGDYNPLHVDPAIARLAGFERPILHGLCSYGVVCRAVLKLLCDNDPARLRVLNVRFASPVYPGETLCVEVWRQGSGVAAVQARVANRDVTVISNGYVEYSPGKC